MTPLFQNGALCVAAAANDGAISGVALDLPAYAAGLRDGMVFARLQSGRIGDVEQQLVLVVRDGDRERMIAYFPRGRGVYARQSLEFDPSLEADREAQCRIVLGGG